MIISKWLSSSGATISSQLNARRSAGRRRQSLNRFDAAEQLEVRSMLSAGGLLVASLKQPRHVAADQNPIQEGGRDEATAPVKKVKSSKPVADSNPPNATKPGKTVPTSGQAAQKPSNKTGSAPSRGIGLTPKPGVQGSGGLQIPVVDYSEVDPRQQEDADLKKKLQDRVDYLKSKEVQQNLLLPTPEPEISLPGWTPKIINREHYSPGPKGGPTIYRDKPGPNIDNPSPRSDKDKYSPQPTSMDPSTWQSDENGFTPGFFDKLGPNFNQPTPSPVYYPLNEYGTDSYFDSIGNGGFSSGTWETYDTTQYDPWGYDSGSYDPWSFDTVSYGGGSGTNGDSGYGYIESNKHGSKLWN